MQTTNPLSITERKLLDRAQRAVNGIGVMREDSESLGKVSHAIKQLQKKRLIRLIDTNHGTTHFNGKKISVTEFVYRLAL